MKALQKAGHTTYLVGGCVRDLLIGVVPKDFDIATTARPEEVRKIIYRAYVIGKRFKLVLVRRDELQFEVATFRKDPAPGDEFEESKGDNLFGPPEDDARRRDFTINGLFYDPIADELIDYAQGMPDLESRWVRMIGNPNVRLIEDPIRILRALRLAHMIGFQLDPALREAMSTHSMTLRTTALPRRREEFLKLMRLKDPSLAFLEARDLGILRALSPTLESAFDQDETAEVFLTHLRHVHDFSVDKQNPAELFALLVLAFVRACVQPDVSKPLKSSEWLEHPKLLPLMRDELGVFKFEQALIARALHLQAALMNADEFARRGVRRQLAILRNEAFPLALTLAERDFSLPPRIFMYWLQSYETALPRIQQLPNRSHQRRRRRRKKSVEETLSKAGLLPNEADTDFN